MPNPRGNIAGFTDKGVPGWEERALDRVRQRQKKTHRNQDRRNGVLVAFDDPFRVLYDAAAARRGISMAGYGRRAIAAFIAQDLNIPLEDVLAHAAYPAVYGQPPVGRQRRTQDTGKGFGPWKVTGIIEL